MTPTELGPASFLAVVVILVVCRGVSRLPRPVGQPPVVGEMLAGAVPGAAFPGVEPVLFPQEPRQAFHGAGN